MTLRQQVLRLWLADAALDSPVVAWAFHDGSDGGGPALPVDTPPYALGSDALADGWFLLQTPQPRPPAPEGPAAHQNNDLELEFLFERRIEAGGDPTPART